MRQEEDADDTGEVIAWELVDPPEWVCEHCYARNGAQEGACLYCGRTREDGW